MELLLQLCFFHRLFVCLRLPVLVNKIDWWLSVGIGLSACSVLLCAILIVGNSAPVWCEGQDVDFDCIIFVYFILIF